ncbi:DUF885 domain-containing protein [Nocardia altamirensis]|uniref:DUF885 domain-containing protein n=1 Tax=Nocardia altamirensis TaxID=472158 RepID=UPI0008406449|nr:DUF885 domain-containing protein [Nocardia altamirensis]
MNGHDELMDLAERYWDSVLEARPSDATLLGDRRFDARIEDLSVAAEERLLATWRALLRQVEALDADRLEPVDQVTRSLLATELTGVVERLAWRPLEMAYDQMEGVHAFALMVAPQINAPQPADALALVERYRQYGDMLGQAVERFRNGVAAGRTPVRILLERSVNQLDSYLSSELSTDPFVTFDGPQDWDGEADWRAQLTEVAREVIRPAFQRYRDVLFDELLPVSRADDKAGLCWLGADGEDIYRRQLRYHTTLPDLGAEEIHELGLAELAALREEYATIGARLFGTADLAEIFGRLRDDPTLRYADGEQIMFDARRALTTATAEMGNWFGRLPKESCDIVPVPEFLAADVAGAYYFAPAADGSRPGTYFVNQYHPTGRARHETASVAYHEAIPGHHLQLTIASELDHLPRFQRQSFANTAFVEGWALYTERLADEMGLYEDDLGRLGMLAGDSWRSSRLVVDTGLHAKGWSRQQAIDFMVANVPSGISELTTEVDRYIGMPGQAVAYKVGQLEIRKQRLAATERLGSAFDIKAFHDVVLGSGSVSLPVLRELVATL